MKVIIICVFLPFMCGILSSSEAASENKCYLAANTCSILKSRPIVGTCLNSEEVGGLLRQHVRKLSRCPLDQKSHGSTVRETSELYNTGWLDHGHHCLLDQDGLEKAQAISFTSDSNKGVGCSQRNVLNDAALNQTVKYIKDQHIFQIGSNSSTSSALKAKSHPNQLFSLDEDNHYNAVACISLGTERSTTALELRENRPEEKKESICVDSKSPLERTKERLKIEMDNQKEVCDKEYSELSEKFTNELKELQIKHKRELEKKNGKNNDDKERLYRELSSPQNNYCILTDGHSKIMRDSITKIKNKSSFQHKQDNNKLSIKYNENKPTSCNEEETLQNIRTFQRLKLLDLYELKERFLKEELDTKEHHLEETQTLLSRHFTHTKNLEFQHSTIIYEVLNGKILLKNYTEIKNVLEKRAKHKVMFEEAKKKEFKELKDKLKNSRKSFKENYAAIGEYFKHKKSEILFNAPSHLLFKLLMKLNQKEKEAKNVAREKYEIRSIKLHNLRGSIEGNNYESYFLNEKENPPRLYDELEFLIKYYTAKQMLLNKRWNESIDKKDQEKIEFHRKLDREKEKFLKDSSERILRLREKHNRELKSFDEETELLGIEILDEL